MSFAYLDIETSWDQFITVIGIYRCDQGTTQLIAPFISPDTLLETLQGVSCLLTYNGTRFDLPVIQRCLGVDLLQHHQHRDLMHDCWRAKLKGGLKAVEQKLGIHRDTEGVDGLQAMKLWASHEQQHGLSATGPAVQEHRAFANDPCCEALDLLLRYNREDCENLEILASKLGVLGKLSSPMGEL